jgi:hypothetical protein
MAMTADRPSSEFSAVEPESALLWSGFRGRSAATAFVVVPAQVILLGIILLVPQDYLKGHAHFFYLAHYCLFLPFFFMARDRCAFLFSPSFLVISHVSISFVIGGYAFAKGYILFEKDLHDFQQWEHFRLGTAYFMSCNLGALLAYSLARPGRARRSACDADKSLARYTGQLVVGALLVAVFSIVPVELSFLSGSGNFAIILQVFGALAISIALAKARWPYRFLVYLGLLLFFAAAQYGDRRIVILLGLSLVFIEAAHLKDLRLSFRRVAVCLIILASVVMLQVTMTIARGLGGFKGSYWRTFQHIEDFTGLHNLATFSLKQTEGPTLLLHSYNGLEYVLEDDSLLRYGSTLARPVVTVVPRAIWPNKPRSFCLQYTKRWSPTLYKHGRSVAINAYAEYFWNLHLLGVLCVVPIFYLLNRVFFFYLHKLRGDEIWSFVYLGVGYFSVLMYARGQGLENPIISLVIAFGVQWLFFNPFIGAPAYQRRLRELSFARERHTASGRGGLVEPS